MDRIVTYPKTVNPAMGPMEGRTCYNMNPCTGCPSLAPNAIRPSFGRMWMGEDTWGQWVWIKQGAGTSWS